MESHDASAGDAPVGDALAYTLPRIKAFLEGMFPRDGRIREAVLACESDTLPVPQAHLDAMHGFMEGNPMYGDSSGVTASGAEWIVYEGDADRYWLESIGHASSCAPFSPTWMISAYALARHAVRGGRTEAVDVGSGDGRIAFCAGLAGAAPYSVEIDPALADLQKEMNLPRVSVQCIDAAAADYSAMRLSAPAFFIGGLAQMGGARLASAVLKGVAGLACHQESEWILAGTHAEKYAPDPLGMAGWGTFISSNHMRMTGTMALPTAWTFGEPEATQYVFARPVRQA